MQLVAAPPPADIDLVTAADWSNSPVPSLAEQVIRDRKLFYATLFPNVTRAGSLAVLLAKTPGQETISASKDRNNILARILVAMAWAKLKYSTTANDRTILLDWKYSVATALGHGQRVAFEVQGLDDSDDLYSLFLYGLVKPIPNPDPFKRSLASHGLAFSSDNTAVMKEVKLGIGPAGLYKNIVGGIVGKHHGIDLAFGGLGNTTISGKLIGPGGSAVDPKTGVMDTKIQHGHLYLHTDERKAKGALLGDAGVLVGLEPSGPGKSDMFNVAHTGLSAVQDSTKNIGVTGGRKMALLFNGSPDKPPAKYGGLWALFNKAQFEVLKTVIAKLDTLAVPRKKQLFWDLLNAQDSDDAQTIVATATGIAKPAPATRPRS